MENQIEIYRRTELDLIKEISSLYTEWKDSGHSNVGDYENQIRLKEKKLSKIKTKINQLEDIKTPEEWSIRIFVLTNYREIIKNNLSKNISIYFPENRNSNEKLEDWIPYLGNSKTIQAILEEFKQLEGYDFKVHYINGHNDFNDWNLEIDNAIKDGMAVAIIDLLGVDSKNEFIVRRFDTQNMKATILPICLKLHEEIRNFMEVRQKQIFTVFNEKLKRHERCCYFSKVNEEDFLIQQLISIYPAKNKIRNIIRENNISREFDFRSLNVKLQ